MTNSEENDLKKIVDGSYEKIVSSKIFLSLLTENALRSPHVLIQLGIAILHDKPIFLVVEKGVKVPEHLKKIATRIEFFESKDGFEAIAKKIINEAELSSRF